MIDISKPPPRWGRDTITGFLDLIRNNQFATFQNMPERFAILSEIEHCFAEASRDHVNPKEPVVPLLMFRSIGAYKAACGTALAGQTAETFTLLRMSVEAAGYALFIYKSPELSEIWLKRALTSLRYATVSNMPLSCQRSRVLTRVSRRFTPLRMNAPSTLEPIRTRWLSLVAWRSTKNPTASITN